MRFHQIFLLILLLRILEAQGQVENVKDNKLSGHDLDNANPYKKSGCPFATLSQNVKPRSHTIKQYEKALKLEEMTREIKRLEQNVSFYEHRITKRESSPSYTYRVLPTELPTSNESRDGKHFRSKHRTFLPSRFRVDRGKILPVLNRKAKKPPFRVVSSPPPALINYNDKPQTTSKQKSQTYQEAVLPNVSSKNLEGQNKPDMAMPNISEISEVNDDEVFECPLEKQETVSHCEANYPYRSFSGRCNNLNTNKNFGKHSSIFRRLLLAEYDDGISYPRIKGVNGGILPNPRHISSVIHHDNNKVDQRYTLALMQWGQFLDHDITLTPFIDALAKCDDTCVEDNTLDILNNTTVVGPCYSIFIPKEDKFFSEKDVPTKKCLPMIRSLPAQKFLGPREQLNAITAYIDSSNLYGSDPCINQQLREYVGGRMKVLKHPMSPNLFKPLMPRHAHNPECKSPTGKCFMTGDDRNSEQPGLVSMHTMMLREHNRIADKIALHNPEWLDEKVFQESRKIIIAINQHITYSEFLPRVLGPDLMKHFELQLQEPESKQPHFNGYRDDCSANIYNEFATAAFRFGHSLIRPTFDLVSEPNATTTNLARHAELRNHFFQPDITFGVHVVDKFLRGMVNMPIGMPDRSITHAVTNHLFQRQGNKYSGQDLASLNIQRGREHGLPGYYKYLNLCSKILHVDKNKFKTFDDLNVVMDADALKDLATVYKDIKDIDLYTGGLSETPLPGALVGRTFGCMIGLQFKKLKKCDRHWYETSDSNIGFTRKQLEEIKKVTLSSIMCRSWDVTSPIQRMAFDMKDHAKNPVLPCLEENHPTITMGDYYKTSRDGRSGLDNIGRSKLPAIAYCDIGGRIAKLGSKIRISACTICECSLPEGNTKCYSDVVKSCKDLTREFGRSAVAVDFSCQAQCPEILQQAEGILSVSPVVPS